MARSVQAPCTVVGMDAGLRACQHKRMLTPCPECDYLLWTEVGSLGAFRMVVFFDHEQGSDTHTETVDHCPRCGLWLHALAIKPSDVAQQSG